MIHEPDGAADVAARCWRTKLGAVATIGAANVLDVVAGIVVPLAGGFDSDSGV